jgi:aminotransferase
MLCTALEDIGFDVHWPEGAYYAFASFKPLQGVRDGFEDDEAASRTLVEEAGIGSVTGRSFFDDPADGAHYLRLCFAKEMPELKQACDQLRAAFG